jgi:excisionase family DNA binding protein
METHTARSTTKERLLTIHETAEETGFTAKAIRQRIFRKQFPHTRIGKRVMIKRSELEKFLSALPGITAQEALDKVTEAEG